MNARLTAFTKLSYAFPAFALAIVGIPVYVYIPKFYTDTLGVPVATAGVILLAIRLLDAVTDPLIGVVSDRAVSRFGRRRPMILAGAVLISVSILFLFNPPRMSSGGATLWFGVWASLLFLSWTIITVPYESLGPELTFDYKERISLFSVRDGFLLAGILAAAASPSLIKALAGHTGGPEAEARIYSVMSALYIPLIIASAGWCVFFIRERTALTGATGILKDLRGLAANRPFLILLVSYTISAIGNNLPAALILYYVEHVLRSSLADFFLLVYFVTGIVFLPLWIRIADRWGKKSAWLGSMAINTGAFSGVFFLGAGDEISYGFLVFLSGAGFGATVAIPSSIQADVIDYDELMTGKRREGQYIGIWSLAKKIAAAGGVGIGLSLLGASGYRPDTVQSDGVILTLRALYSLAPSLCNAVAILIALAYPITGEMHARIREAISAREGGNEVDDPLAPGKTYPPRGGAPH